MSWPNKASQAVIVIDPLGDPSPYATHTITVNNLQIPTSLKMWEGREGLSITGKRRNKNIIRGFDRFVTFEWADIRNQESTILALIDDLKVATDNDYPIRINASGDTDYIYVVPDDAMYDQNYVNQIRRTPTTVKFALATIQDTTGYNSA